MRKILLILLFISTLSYSQNKDTRVWFVVKVNFSERDYVAVQPMGTAFFISPHHFLTANHVVKDTLPLGRFTGYQYFLLNADGSVISHIKIQERDEDADFALGYANTDGQNIYVWKYTDKYAVTDEVYHIGFPQDVNEPISRIRFKKTGNKQLEKDSVEIFNKEYSGVVIGDIKGAWIIDSVLSSERTVIYVNFDANDGTSGGPLALKATDEAIGIFSFGNNDKEMGRSMSVRIKDYMELIKLHEDRMQTMQK